MGQADSGERPQDSGYRKSTGQSRVCQIGRLASQGKMLLVNGQTVRERKGRQDAGNLLRNQVLIDFTMHSGMILTCCSHCSRNQ